MATDLPHFSITVDDELLAIIEDFQFRNHYPNRNMAINALLIAGAEALKDVHDPTPKRPTRKKKAGDRE